MNIKELMEIWDKHENLHAGMSHLEQDTIQKAYHKTSCTRAVKLREIVDMMPEIKKMLSIIQCGEMPFNGEVEEAEQLEKKLEQWEG